MKTKSKIITIAIAAAAFLAIAAYSVTAGNYAIAPSDLWKIASGNQTAGGDKEAFIVYQVRLPRILMASLTGAVLATGGTAMQAVFKNPLVSPFVIGLSAGASLGAAIGIVYFNGSGFAIEALAFSLAVGAVLAAYFFSGLGSDTTMLLLFGVIITSSAQSAIGLLQYFADPEHQLPALTFWMLGGFDGIQSESLKYPFAVSIICMTALFCLSFKMNILTMGDIEARTLGVNAGRLKFWIIVLSTLMVSSCISRTGIIGWVGLTTPHISRILLGPDNRFVIILAAALGASFLLCADDIARTATTGEIPIGIITGVIGAPIFAAILFRAKRSGWN